MNGNWKAYLIILAAALNFSGCGGAVQSAGGDGKKAGAPSDIKATSPTPAANAGAGVAATPADNATAPAAPATSAGVSAPGPGTTTPAAEARGTRAAPPARMPTPQIGSGGNDFFLFTQARAAINGDADLKAANVVVEVKEGVVTLSGAVASAALKSKAEELARGARPKEVRNQLRVVAAK